MTSLGRSRGIDLAVLLMAFAILMGVCSFIVVAYGVSAGITQHLDEELLKAPRDPADPSKTLGPAWLEEFGRDLTALGGVAGLCLMTLAVSGYLLICGKYRALAFVLAATLGGLLLNALLKERVDRRRPDVVPYKSQVTTSSSSEASASSSRPHSARSSSRSSTRPRLMSGRRYSNG